MTIPQESSLSMFLLQKPVNEIQNYFYSTPLQSTDFSTILPIEVVVVQIYP